MHVCVSGCVFVSDPILMTKCFVPGQLRIHMGKDRMSHSHVVTQPVNGARHVVGIRQTGVC